MTRSCFMLLLLLGAAAICPTPFHATQTAASVQSEGHTDWVGETLKRMLTVKPGMTRDDLLKVFTTEGGIFNRLQRTFVSRDCRYFKIDVEFQPAGPPSRDRNGALTAEDGRDVIVKISRPYLAFSITD